MSTRGCTPPRFARREFLLGIGAGVPILASGCIETEFDSFRESDLYFDDNADFPAGGLAPYSGKVSVAVDVEKTVQGQDFDADEFACSVSKSMAGVQIGDQIRLTRNDQHYALFNVAERRESDDSNVVRIGTKGRDRLGTSNVFSANLHKPVPAVGLTDAQAEDSDEFVERLVDNGNYDGLVVIAPHGGMIERNTCRQAEAVAAELSCSSWICKGYKAGGGSYSRWHITSTKISPRSFPGLKLIANRGFAYSVAFHGMSASGILIGGAAPQQLKEMLASAINDTLSKDIQVKVAKPGDANSGTSKKNVVNWLTAGGLGGVQIEQSMDVRVNHWEEVAEAVSNVYSQLI
jgi:phage replication-related protein YjqB (UPF0714/DUF867 family)